MVCPYAPYEWKSKQEVDALLATHGCVDVRRLTRGVAIDQIEQISTGLPYVTVKYGEGQLKLLARLRAAMPMKLGSVCVRCSSVRG